MRNLRRLSTLLCLSWAAAAHAAGPCPALPGTSPVHWDQRVIPGFSVCRALADDDGRELLSVTLGESTPFRPQNALLEGSARIDGHKVRWYRGQDGFNPELLLRETVVRLARRRVAHIVVRAENEAQLLQGLQLAEGLRFADP